MQPFSTRAKLKKKISFSAANHLRKKEERLSTPLGPRVAASSQKKDSSTLSNVPSKMEPSSFKTRVSPNFQLSSVNSLLSKSLMRTGGMAVNSLALTFPLTKLSQFQTKFVMIKPNKH